MMLMRSVTAGLLGACVYILLGFPGAPRPEPQPIALPAVAAAHPISVVDVAHGVTPDALASLVQLHADERVIAVGDQPVANDLAAGAAIAARTPSSGRFLDLTVAGSAGSRRILVLMH